MTRAERNILLASNAATIRAQKEEIEWLKDRLLTIKSAIMTFTYYDPDRDMSSIDTIGREVDVALGINKAAKVGKP
jgi:hypothetical protein